MPVRSATAFPVRAVRKDDPAVHAMGVRIGAPEPELVDTEPVLEPHGHVRRDRRTGAEVADEDGACKVELELGGRRRDGGEGAKEGQ